MGFFHYGQDATVEIDDVVLHHLRAVIVAKMRRNESFLLNWDQDAPVSVWISPSVAMTFAFSAPLEVKLIHETLERMIAQTYTASGLTLASGPSDAVAKSDREIENAGA